MHAWLATMLALALGASARAEEVSATPPPATFGGFDVGVSLFEVSGLSFEAEAYENQLALVLSPSFDLGSRFFSGTWAEPLSLAAELQLEGELSGSDSRFRGTHFGSSALLRQSPERLALPADQIDGLERRVLLSDLTLSASHDTLAKLPWNVVVGGSVRVVLPTSISSWNASLVAAPSAAVSLSRELSRFTFGYSLRGVLYLFGSATVPIAYNPEPVVVNGQEVEPYRPTSGELNPSHGVVNTLSIAVELPRTWSLSAEYSLLDTWAHPLSGCQVPGVPTADVCRDGPLVGSVQMGGGQRDSHTFHLEAGFKPLPWGSLAVGLSTFRPLRAPDGSIGNPFLHITRDNYSTLYLSFAVSAAELAHASSK